MMTQGHCQGIGHVRRFRSFIKSELSLDSPLNLLLGCPAISGDRFLDPRGIVTNQGQAALLGRQENHAASMPHQNSRPWMLVVGIKLLYRNHFRLKLIDHLYYTVVQKKKPGSHILAGAADDARFANFRL